MTPEVRITVRYSCVLCGLQRVACSVKAREAEDVVVWMRSVQYALAADHERRSPHCHPETLTEVLIPIGGVDKVGGVPIQ